MGKKKANIFIYVILCILTVVVLYPLYFIVLNLSLIHISEPTRP